MVFDMYSEVSSSAGKGQAAARPLRARATEVENRILNR